MPLRLEGEAYAEASLYGDVSISDDPLEILEMIKKIDRPPKVSAQETFTTARSFIHPTRIGVETSAGLGRVSAQCSILEAEAKGPNVAAGAEVSLKSLKAKAFARAELASASASAGPLKAKVGLALDTGVSAGLTGIEANFLGTGFSIGRRTSVSLFGNGFEFNF